VGANTILSGTGRPALQRTEGREFAYKFTLKPFMPNFTDSPTVFRIGKLFKNIVNSVVIYFLPLPMFSQNPKG
jgi:hypothetical protein